MSAPNGVLPQTLRSNGGATLARRPEDITGQGGATGEFLSGLT
jgi:hypothetical protein